MGILKKIFGGKEKNESYGYRLSISIDTPDEYSQNPHATLREKRTRIQEILEECS